MEKKPHKHAELIKAWADGAEIECLDKYVNRWYNARYPRWKENMEYRIKPEEDPYREFKQAHENGKTIQYSNISRIWIDCANLPAFNLDPHHYRVKPYPAYVPFEWEDRKELRAKWIKDKDGTNEMFITDLAEDGIEKTFYINGQTSHYLFNTCTFMDGSPFGKLKED